MSSTINASTSGIVNTADSSGVLELQTGGVTAIYMDTSQNVTIPQNLTVNGTLTFTGGGGGVTTFSGGTTGLLPSTPTAGAVALSGTLIYQNGGTGLTTSGSAGNLLVSTGTGWASQTPATASLVTTSSLTSTLTGYSALASSNAFTGTSNANTFAGYVRVGGAYVSSAWAFTASTTSLGTNGIAGLFDATPVANSTAVACQINNTSSYLTSFFYGTIGSGAAVGTITTNGTSVAYNTTSDRRLKTNIADLTGSGAVIDLLKPRTFNWISNNTADTGFIADEMQQVLPSSVNGEVNGTNEDGSPRYQSIDPSTPEMIALLVCEIQSLRKRVTALEVGA